MARPLLLVPLLAIAGCLLAPGARGQEDEAAPGPGGSSAHDADSLASTFDKIEGIIGSQRALAKELDGLLALQEERLRAMRSGGEVDWEKLKSIKHRTGGGGTVAGAMRSGAALGSSAGRMGGMSPSDETCNGAILEYDKAKMQKTIISTRDTWSDHIKMLSTVAVDEDVTVLHTLPQDAGLGISRYVAIGVTVGKVYVFRPNGELLADYDTGSDSAVTSMLSFAIRRNETLIYTGHEDGSVIGHRVIETVRFEPNVGDNLYALNFTGRYTLVPKDHHREQDDGTYELGAVQHIEVYKVNHRRFIMAADGKGLMHIYRENGTFIGSTSAPEQQAVVMLRPVSGGMAVLTEQGVGWMDPRTLKLHMRPCMNLNSSSIVAARGDTAITTKVYALTQDGDMLQMFLTGDKANMRCNVKVRRPLGLTPNTALSVIKSYLLMGTASDVAVFNTSGTGRWGPKGVLQESIAGMAAAYGVEVGPANAALLASNKHNLIVVGLGGGMVGMFNSELPVQKPSDWNTKLWSQPLFIVAIVLVGVWQFYRQRATSAYGSGGRGGGFEEMDYAKFEAAAKKLSGGAYGGGGGMGGGGMGGMGSIGGGRR